MSKPHLKLGRKGWFKYGWRMRTGAIDIRTGAHVPYVRDGKAWPPEIEIWVGPFDNAAAAFRA